MAAKFKGRAKKGHSERLSVAKMRPARNSAMIHLRLVSDAAIVSQGFCLFVIDFI